MSDTNLSRFMAKLLRHDARSRGLVVSPEGYVDVDVVLIEARRGGLNFTQEAVRRIVTNDNKGRFKLRNDGEILQIKATQGHSFNISDNDLIQITRPSDVRSVLHGTKSCYWESIKSQGLSRRRRKHIHFAQGESGVQSGFPPGCDIAIEIDIQSALQAGIKFCKSENDVVLSSGNSSGVIPKEHFRKAYYIRTRQPLDF